jgi:transposase
MLVRTFPELPSVVSDILGKSVSALLRVAPAAGAVASLGVEGVEQIIKAASRGRFGEKKAKQIVYAAKDSVGYGLASSAVHVEMGAILNTVEALTREIEAIESEMSRLLAETEEGALVLSIPGVGEVTAAIVLGETGGLRQYQNPSQIRKLAGLDLCGSQSGDRQSEKRISKRGRALLRKSLYQAAVACIRSNDILVRFYRGLTEPGRNKTLAKKKALIAVTGKLVEIMFSLVRSGTAFDPKYKWAPPGKHEPAVQAVAA